MKINKNNLYNSLDTFLQYEFNKCNYRNDLIFNYDCFVFIKEKNYLKLTSVFNFSTGYLFSNDLNDTRSLCYLFYKYPDKFSII